MIHESKFLIRSLFSPSVGRSQELNIYDNSIPKEATDDHNDNAKALTCVGTEAVRIHQETNDEIKAYLPEAVVSKSKGNREDESV